MNRKTLIISNIIILFNIYFMISVIFSIIYIFIEYLELGYIANHYSKGCENIFITISKTMYFSFITLFAVGYGDLTPFGMSKVVAIIQAFLGYILPYAILLNYLIFKPRFIKKKNSK